MFRKINKWFWNVRRKIGFELSVIKHLFGYIIFRIKYRNNYDQFFDE